MEVSQISEYLGSLFLTLSLSMARRYALKTSSLKMIIAEDKFFVIFNDIPRPVQPGIVYRFNQRDYTASKK